MYLWRFATRHHRGGQEAGRATYQQSIHHVRPWHSKFRIEEYSKGSSLWKLCRITKLKKCKKRLLEFLEKHKCGTIVERHSEDEQSQVRMHEQRYTQSDMEEFDSIASENRMFVATLEERTYY